MHIDQTYLDNYRIPSVALSGSVCSQNNPKIALVLMAGEQGTQIRDNLKRENPLREGQNRHHQLITLYENTKYRIRIQLDCFPHGKGGYPSYNCNVIQDVNVLIDLNKDERFDERESRIPSRWPLHSSIALGIYDLEISIPGIDDRDVRSGAYRMRIIVTPSEDYRRTCGNSNYREVRDYTVNIQPRVFYPDQRGAYCFPRNAVCSSGYHGIGLVSLLGEAGTKLHDEFKACDSTNNYHDRSNQAVMLKFTTRYTFRIDLYCIQSLSYDSSVVQTSCQENQYLGVWIDLNLDGTFDPIEERVIPSNRYENGQVSSSQQFSLVLPTMSSQVYTSQHYRLRMVLVDAASKLHPCPANVYGEVRDYSIKIVSYDQELAP